MTKTTVSRRTVLGAGSYALAAAGNYVTLRVGKTEYFSRDSIKRLSMQLAGLAFIRIARSLLVNAAAVSSAEAAGHGTFALTLTSGVCVHSSPAYRDSILRIIPLPALSKRYAGTATWRSIASISGMNGFVTMAGRVIPKWVRRFAVLLISRDEIGRSYCAMPDSVHRGEHERRICHASEQCGRLRQRHQQLCDSIRPER
jgi:hypothetical protein